MARHCGIVVDRSVSGVVPLLSCSGDKYDLSSTSGNLVIRYYRHLMCLKV